MAYLGWLQLAGMEIVNNQRAIQYARHMAPEIIPECEDCPDLATALGDAEYRSPALDEAPWWDPNVEVSSKFAGLYALDIAGLEDDSREAPVFQAAFDGGAIGRVRRRTKDIRVTGLLIAEDDSGLSFGIEWLKNALNGSECPDPAAGCSGDDLCFFSACPDIPEGSVDPEAEPIRHDVALGPWEVTSGTWLNGRWQYSSTPGRAVGPSLGDLPCDEVVLTYDLDPTEGARVRLYAVDEDTGAPLLPGREVVLQRTNWARNPSFSTGTITYWTPGPNVDLSAEAQGPDYGEAAATSVVASGETIATVEGAQGASGDVFSGRMRVQIDPEGLTWRNIVPNPAVRTLGGFSDPSLIRDTSTFFTDAGSARMDVSDDGTQSVGPIIYGQEDDQYAIRVDDSETYGLSAYVRSSVATDAGLVATWLDSEGDSIAAASYPTSSIPANTWVRLEEATSGAIDGAARVTLGVQFFAPSESPMNAGDSVFMDALMVSPQQPLVAYFDGDSEDAFWDGLPHSSPSTLSPSGDSACVQLRVNGPTSATLGAMATVVPGSPTEVEVSNAPISTNGQVTLSLVACGDIPSGTLLRLSRSLLERSAQSGDYFDGYTEDTESYTYHWNGPGGLAPSAQQVRSPVDVTVPLSNQGVRPAIEALGGSLVQVDSVTASHRPAADPFECADQYERTIREVTATSGPTILERFDTCNGRMWRVEFFLTAAVPWVWQRLRPEFQVLPGSNFEWRQWEDDCTEEVPEPINDPDCPLPPPPPRAPAIAGCVEDPFYYRRRSVLIPGDVVAPSQSAVPIISIEVDGSMAARQTRIRFYANPLSRENLDDLDPCGYCGEFVVTYIPGGSTIVLDGMTESAVVDQGAGVRRPASHLLRSSTGGPMRWPLLTCGIPYTMTVDVTPTNIDVVTTNVELAARS